jgi:hypothetical protein
LELKIDTQLSCFPPIDQKSAKIFVFQRYPVFYPEFLTAIRSSFLFEDSQKFIIHYEHRAGIYRPLIDGDDFYLLINYRFHLDIFTLIRLKISVDQTSPPIEVEKFPRILKNSNSTAEATRKTRNSGCFILEDCEDPILAPRNIKGVVSLNHGKSASMYTLCYEKV